MFLTCEQSRAVDRLAVDEFGMSSLVLMENAGRGCADLLCELGIHGPVVICCGRGNNGGDGFVLARHLDLRGYAVRVLLFGNPEKLSADAAANFRIAVKAGLPLHVSSADNDASWEAELANADWLVDALLGTGSHGDPRPPLDGVIRCMNQSIARKLAIDLPSGLNADTGEASATTFRADHTATFVAAKVGFQSPAAQRHLGALHVLDIGTPPKLLERVMQR